MAGFKFKLQNLLNIKEKLEEQKKNEYLSSKSSLEQKKNEKRVVEQRIQDCLEDMKKEIQVSANFKHLQNFQIYIQTLKKKIKELENNIKKIEELVDKKKRELLEIIKERKSLEILKEKELEIFNQEELKIEQQSIDERISFEYGKQSQENS